MTNLYHLSVGRYMHRMARLPHSSSYMRNSFVSVQFVPIQVECRRSASFGRVTEWIVDSNFEVIL
jgi:hypothetical protein